MQLIFASFYLKIGAIILFFIFGIALLYEGISNQEEEEDFETKMKEVENEMQIRRRGDSLTQPLMDGENSWDDEDPEDQQREENQAQTTNI